MTESARGSRRRGTCAGGLSLAALALALAVRGAAAQGPPANIGANPPGTVFYAVASGLARVVTEAGTARLAVQPYTGSSTFLENGELEFGVVNAVDMALAYRGAGFTRGSSSPQDRVRGQWRLRSIRHAPAGRPRHRRSAATARARATGPDR